MWWIFDLLGAFFEVSEIASLDFGGKPEHSLPKMELSNEDKLRRTAAICGSILLLAILFSAWLFWHFYHG